MKIWLLILLATAVAGKPTAVSCTNWAPKEIRIDWAGWAYIGRPKIYLRPEICKDASKGKRYALRILGHEVGHSVGIVSEEKADTYADSKMKIIVKTFNENS